MSDLNKNKVLVTGANGLLGQKLAERLLQMPNVEVCLTGKGACRLHKAKDKYQILDVVDNHEVDLLFSQFLPDVVIHAAAMTQVDDCEIDKELCYVQNVTAVENLIRACNRYNTHLIYLSTDFVFDGISGPYKEDDVPNPISYYGYCKLEAEKKVQQMMSTWSIVRTILVFGVLKDLSRNNIVLWVKNNLEKGQSIKVVTDQFRTPTLACLLYTSDA
ncbi:MAG: NAD(P)-dependent oxidoreductase, partial [Candidatus Competibacteraceae bacterium]|nr:NAD(P)-dependent oxidoreductase [Candidatus Competibacteraceae bacterium]